ncbi:glycosyltransferase [Microcella alkalica]|uniref:glycosyltransferase n=1 Tax=Microcella alkalica TaxID=355930 RepID=UPI00145F25D7|nr:glycosyltransferase [Microcella alkalica]
MQARVTAVLVARRGGEPLRQTLSALAEQSRRPDRFVVVDAAGDAATTAALMELAPTHAVTAPTSTAFGDGVARAVAALPPHEVTESPYGGVEEWLWLLRDDATPDSRALERLLGAVEIAPSVAIAGPKQMVAARPTVIAEYGETLTRSGATVAIAERELDQAQHDRLQDVLAMGEAGLLVRRAVWEALGGTDPALPTVDAALDLCVRARLAGHRVVGVPLARVFVHGSTAQWHRPGVAPRTVARWRRTAQLHRRLVYAPAALVPLHWLALVPLAVMRALGHLLGKRPALAPGELVAALAVAFSGAAVPAARRRLARGRSVGWAAIDALRMRPDEVRRRRAIARDAQLGAGEADARPRPDFFPGGALVVLGLGLIGAALMAPLVTAPALAGGALGPLATDAPTLWQGVLATSAAPPDPFAFVLAALGSLTFWQPSLAIVILWITAPALAGLGAWWATASLVERRGPAAAVAVVYALSPALAVSLVDARLPALVALLAAPWLVAAAARAPRSWSATAAAGLLAAVTVASAPSLLPALVVTWAAWMLARPRRAVRLLTLAVPTVALLAPLAIAQVLRGTPLGLLADPGRPAQPAPASPTGIVLGWPDLGRVIEPVAALLPADVAPALIPVVLAALAAPLAVLVLASLGLREGRRAIVPLVLAASGLLTAVLVSNVAVATAEGVAVRLDTAPALGLYWLGLALAAGLALDGLRRAAVVPALAVVVAAALAVAPALAALPLGTATVRPAPDRGLPAIVAAAAADEPGIATLVLTPLEEGIAARLERGSGAALIDERTVLRTAGLGVPASTGGAGLGGPTADQLAPDLAASDLADLAVTLAVPSGADAAPLLESADVRFVLLAERSRTTGSEAPAAVRAAITASLDADPLLVPVGDTDAGLLWRVVADDETPAAIAARPATAWPFLAAQLGILALTLLLAVPTGRRPRRVRAEHGTIDDPATTFAEDDDD